jgi:predicted RNA-binding Zn-ribbon protein involved in translation (DUF1610 family)
VHRAQAELALTRPLLPGEVVHHIDEDKANNEASNLMIFKNESSHQLVHKLAKEDVTLIQCDDGAYLAVRKLRVCAVCGREFALPRHAKKTQKHCSPECGRKSLRRVDRPSKEELIKLVYALPMLQLSKQFGVSDKAIAKWCNEYGIEKPPVGYWAKRRSLGH